jgi:hypothetical protein
VHAKHAIDQSQVFHKKGLTRSHQNLDQLPKLSRGGQLGGVSIIEKFGELTAATQKKKSCI